jgi:hypothetical protein
MGQRTDRLTPVAVEPFDDESVSGIVLGIIYGLRYVGDWVGGRRRNRRDEVDDVIGQGAICQGGYEVA